MARWGQEIEDQEKIIEWLKVGRDACLLVYDKERPDTPKRLKAVEVLGVIESLIAEFEGGREQYKGRARLT